MKTVRTYSLEWLDSLITVTLNPEKPYRQRMTDSDVSSLVEKVPVEALQVQYELCAQIFALYKDSQACHLASKYYNALTSLQATLLSYRSNPLFMPEQLTGLDVLLLNCLADLISFVGTRFTTYIHPVAETQPASSGNDKATALPLPAERHKILCTLSADQIALVLRAADESQILKARSMNAVFKFIIPFLSTQYKEHLSAAAVRSKAYNPEEVDRDAAVAALQKIIKKIQGY